MGRLNKPAQDGYTYRSPGQTNAKDLTPNLNEDVVASQRADVERIRKGLEAPAKREFNRRMQQEAAGRAILRTGARGNAAAAALLSGMDIGEELNKNDTVRSGVRKAIDKTVGPLVDKIATRGDRVTLTPETKRRAEEEEGFRTAERALRKVDGVDDEDESPKKYARGGKVKASASRRGDGIAQRGKTRGRMV